MLKLAILLLPCAAFSVEPCRIEIIDKENGWPVPKDGFGCKGVRTTLKPGGSFRIEVTRRNIAKRLGRLTGAGLFAE